jgi:GTP 3',8-cyclase
MPEEEYTWLPRTDLLSFEELTRITTLFAELGVDRVRLTGGEPLVRRHLPNLIGMLKAIPGIGDVALTTNGVLLEDHCADLAAAGLDRVTVSLDSADSSRYRDLTQRDALPRVLAGIRAAGAAGFGALKLNAVVLRGFNDSELASLLGVAREASAVLRFIEYMDVGGATQWSTDSVVPRDEILTRLSDHFGTIEHLEATSAPARRYRLPDGTIFGIIASTSAPFCESCNRCRLTADGMLYTCLYARDGVDLRAPLRAGASDAELKEIVELAWSARNDRGAEERLRLAETRAPLASSGELKGNPHLEMHTRGG